MIFNLGYVGCLGYELKAQTCGQAAPSRTARRRALVRRSHAIDHREGSCYLLASSRPGDDADAVAWLDDEPIGGAGTAGRERVVARHAAADRDEKFATPSCDRAAARATACMAACIEQIYEGESYEICLTNTITSAVPQIDPLKTCSWLRISPVPYGALLETEDDVTILCGAFLWVKISTASWSQSPSRRPRGATGNDEALRLDLAGPRTS